MWKTFLKRKREAEFSKFVEEYTPYISTVVYNVCRQSLTREDIEEVVASVFIAVWQQNVDTKKSNIKGYLAGIARNTTLNRLRKVKSLSPMDDDYIASNSDVAESLERKELSLLLNRLVEALPEPDRTILIRYYWFYNDTGQIAKDLHLNRSTVLSKLSRARAKLKKVLTERGYGYEEV